MAETFLKPVFVGTEEIPYDEGEPQGPTIRPGEVDPVGREGAWTLTGLAAGHVLFQPALIRAAGMVTDPVDLVWAENGLPKADAPYRVDLGWAAFDGIPAPEAHTLLACPREHAKILIPALARVVFGSPGVVDWTVVHQRLDLVDRKLLAGLTHQPPTPPTVPVDLFGLSGPRGSLLWRPPTDPWTTGFRLMQVGPPKKPSRRPFSPPTT